jgi:integrator complex subunit 11
MSASLATFSVTCYGAASEVGRSCILVEMSGHRILLDCGANIGTSDPNEFLPRLPNPLPAIDLVLISHIHTDHLACLPWLTEVRGCKAPVYMTRASARLAKIMLEDFVKVSENTPYNKIQLDTCVGHIHSVDFNQRFRLIADTATLPGVSVTAYPAGHLLGAAAFFITSGGRSFLYTGDFSGTADHHLSGHGIPRLFPDVLITESTYGNRTREPMYKRARTFVQQVHRCVLRGGRVLIPVFAVGRLQEILLMLNDYWERMGCDCPILYASPMGHRATEEYKKCVRWMNPTVQTGFYDLGKQTYNFASVRQWVRDEPVPTPCVMVATPGMLNNGQSHEFLIGQQWYADPKNLVVFPGYCSERTLGRAILDRGPDNKVVWESKEGKHIDITIRCKIERISFSAHADQFEILTMCERLRPREVVTVHGDRDAVATLAQKISDDLKVKTHVPELEQRIQFESRTMQPVEIDKECVHGASFEGAVKVEGSVWRIVPLRRAAAETGWIVSGVRLKRRVQTNATFDEIITVLKALRLITADETFIEGEPLQTHAFLCEFVENGLLLTYDVGHKSSVNTLCCLLARSPKP